MNKTQSKLERNIKDLVLRAFQELEDVCLKRETGKGLETGFADLDSTINGLRPAEVFAVGARPAMGKTALALNITEHVALHCERSVAVFNLNTSPEHWILRMLYSAAQIDIELMKRGFVDRNDMERIASVMSQISKSKIFVDSRCGLSIGELEETARILASEDRLDLIVIDNLRSMRFRLDEDRENRWSDISKILERIKHLAKELRVAVILFTDVNRNPEDRVDRRPRIRDLHQSSLLERHADFIGLLWRMAYYAENEQEDSGYTELVIAKNSRGPFGIVPLRFYSEHHRFEGA